MSWAALEIGREGDLEELWGSDFWQESPTNQSAPFVAYLVRSRRMSVLIDFVRRWAEEREDDEGPSDLVSSVAEQLLALGHVDDLRAFFPVAEEIAEGTLAYDDAVKAALAGERLVPIAERRPSPAEHASLAKQLAEDKKKKSVTGGNVDAAVARGDHDLALEALPHVDLMERPTVALAAVAMAETGSPSEPW